MRLLSALFDVAMLPIAVVKDVFTLVVNDRSKSYTREKIEEIEDNL